MNTVRCDLKGCPSTTVEHAVSPWLHVERSGVLRRDQGPWGFCSWAHLAEFAGAIQ